MFENGERRNRDATVKDHDASEELGRTNGEKQSSNADKWIDKLQRIKISQDKKEKVVIVFLLGIFFLLIATPVSTISNNRQSQENPENVKTENNVIIEETDEKDAYIERLENKLEQTIQGMEGAGEVLVMITLKDSGEKILDKNQPYESSSEKSKEDGKETERSDIKSEQETVLIEEEGNTLPIVVQELYPDIEGVVVICEGGDNSELALRIKEVVQALFSIETHKIVVCKLQT